jgi:hypothetical protein
MSYKRTFGKFKGIPCCIFAHIEFVLSFVCCINLAILGIKHKHVFAKNRCSTSIFSFTATSPAGGERIENLYLKLSVAETNVFKRSDCGI